MGILTYWWQNTFQWGFAHQTAAQRRLVNHLRREDNVRMTAVEAIKHALDVEHVQSDPTHIGVKEHIRKEFGLYTKACHKEIDSIKQFAIETRRIVRNDLGKVHDTIVYMEGSPGVKDKAAQDRKLHIGSSDEIAPIKARLEAIEKEIVKDGDKIIQNIAGLDSTSFAAGNLLDTTNMIRQMYQVSKVENKMVREVKRDDKKVVRSVDKLNKYLEKQAKALKDGKGAAQGDEKTTLDEITKGVDALAAEITQQVKEQFMLLSEALILLQHVMTDIDKHAKRIQELEMKQGYPHLWAAEDLSLLVPLQDDIKQWQKSELSTDRIFLSDLDHNIDAK